MYPLPLGGGVWGEENCRHSSKSTDGIFGTVLCCAVYDICEQRYASTYEQFLEMSVGLSLGLVFVSLFTFSILCVFLV